MIFTASYLNAINFKEGNKTFPYYLWFGAGAAGFRDYDFCNFFLKLLM